MTLAEIKPMHGESLYDREGNIVGKWNGERGMFFDGFVVRECACSMEALDTGEQADYECAEHIMHCMECGAEFGYVLYSEDGDVDMDVAPNYCPDCGARVVD